MIAQTFYSDLFLPGSNNTRNGKKVKSILIRIRNDLYCLSTFPCWHFSFLNPPSLHNRSLSHSFARSFFIAQFCAIVLYIAFVCTILLYRIRLHNCLYRIRLQDRSLSRLFARSFFIAFVCAIVLYRIRLHDRSLSHSFAQSFFIAFVCTIVLYCICLRDRSLSHNVARSFFIAGSFFMTRCFFPFLFGGVCVLHRTLGLLNCFLV